MPEWDYGGAFLRHPCENSLIRFDNGSMVKPFDITKGPLPSFMDGADILFCDPPWNMGNLRSFYTKAGDKDVAAYDWLLNCLSMYINGLFLRACFIEIGKEHLADIILMLRKKFRWVTFYNSSYYHKPENKCYIVQGTQSKIKLPLEDMDEEDAIAWICGNSEYDCIADPCMGRGLVGLHAYKNGRRFVGTELNHKRLSVLLENITKLGGSYKRMEE